MNITNSLFSNSNKEIKSLIIAIQNNLKNHNEFPRDLFRYYQKKDPLGLLLQNVINYYKKTLTKSNVDIVKDKIKSDFDVKHFDYICPNLGDDVVNVILRILNVDMNDNFFNISSYLNKPTSELELYKQTGIIFDDEGLVEIDNRFSLKKDSILFNGGYLVYYSPFLRRFYTSNFIEVTELISRLAGKIKIRISLDDFRMLKKTTHNYEIFDKDHWRGERFAQEKLNSGKYQNVVVYGRKDINIDDNTGLYSSWPIIRTEFRIRNKEKGIKQVEIEEIIPREKIVNIIDGYHVNKYLHFLWDSNKNGFSHLDFAILVYNLKDYNKRLETQWSLIPTKESIRKKIFRIDDFLSYDDGIELIAQFFRYNELINQFFTGQ